MPKNNSPALTKIPWGLLLFVLLSAAALAVYLASQSHHHPPPASDLPPEAAPTAATQPTLSPTPRQETPTPASHPATSRLLADVTAIVPAQPFTLAVLFTIEPDWHLYWLNPGDAGLPTNVALELPAALTASPWRYPLPQPFTQPGDIVGYGYQNTALLAATITPSADLPIGQPLTLKAHASWLACRQRCLPGTANLQLTLPVARQTTPAHQTLFQQWANKYPLPADSPDAPLTQFQLTQPDAKPYTYQLSLTWTFTPQTIQSFPSPLPRLQLLDLTTRTADQTTTFTFTLEPLKGLETAAMADDDFTLLITAHDPTGQRHGLTVVVPLPKTNTPG